MSQEYSDLELVRYDDTARAPQRDYDATAFELDVSALAPQTVPSTTPQVLYNSSYPEVHDNNEGPPKEPTLIHHNTKTGLKWSWMTMTLILAATIAIGLGTGIGIWRRRSKHISDKSSSTVSSPSPQNHTIAPAAQYILNDTSLAAVSLANGDRHLFFQDNTGLIRRAIRTASNGQWSTSSYLNASSNAKQHTPLAAIIPVGITDSESGTEIGLYYISESHVLSSSLLVAGVWAPDPTIGNYSIAVDTRSLSVSSFPTEDESSQFDTVTNSTSKSALLYYENPTKKVSALLQRISTEITQNFTYPQPQWVDITSQNSTLLPDEFRNIPSLNSSNISDESGPNATLSKTWYESNPNATFSSPFTSATNFSGFTVGAIFYSPNNASLMNGGPIVESGYQIGPSGAGNFTEVLVTAPDQSQNYSSISQSDIATFGRFYAIWVNGTQPVVILQGSQAEAPDGPDNLFPFARITSVTLADQSATFLYHQINGTTFAEEQWDNSLNAWLPSVYIAVSDS